jgi:hypothetical protein
MVQLHDVPTLREVESIEWGASSQLERLDKDWPFPDGLVRSEEPQLEPHHGEGNSPSQRDRDKLKWAPIRTGPRLPQQRHGHGHGHGQRRRARKRERRLTVDLTIGLAVEEAIGLVVEDTIDLPVNVEAVR